MGRLIQLELTDFKSYAGRTQIGPFDPFTSIIGPNGSGKSNLMDAVSFVLGVPSSKLRSNNLSELVHRGANAEAIGRRKGKKTAQPQTSSVTAVYEKGDKTIVRFTRTVSVSGQSSYLVDGSEVSFADYNKLLEAEGILIKARNFLVFQGDVEAIANKTPKELTRLLEQISGSESCREEYEHAKEEHDRALESSTFAFNKRRGLSAEIKAVQEQKEEVVKFEELLAERQDLQTEVALCQLKLVENNALKLANTIDTKQAELATIDKEHTAAGHKYQKTRKEHAKIMKEVLAAERQLKRAVEEDSRGNPQVIVLQEKVKSMEKKIQEGLKTQERLLHERDRLISESTQLAAELKSLDQTRQAKEREYEGRQIVIPADYLAEYNQLKAEADNRTAKDKLKLDALERKISPQLLQRSQIEGKIGELQLRKGQFEQELSIVTDRISEINNALQETTNKLSELSSQISSKQMRRRKLFEDEAELGEKLRSISENLLEARALEQESERQASQREAIESLMRIFPGVLGSLLSIVSPSAKKYEEALLAVLGGNLDSMVVVEEQRVAIECVKYLKEQRVPPLTFLPLDSLSAPTGLDRLRQGLPEGVRLACDLLRTTNSATNASNVSKAVQFVCGTAVVTDSLVLARSVISSPPHNIGIHKAATMQGHIVHGSGLLTGGRLGEATKKWEEKRVREWKTERDQLVGALQELSKEARKLDSEERFSSDRIDLEERARFLESELVGSERRLQGVQDQLVYIDSELSDRQVELGEIEAHCTKTTKEMNDIYIKIGESISIVFAEFSTKTGIKNVYESRSDAAARELADFRSESAAVAGKLAFQLSLIEHAISRNEEEGDGLKRTIADHEKSLHDTKQELSTLSLAQNASKTKIDALRKECDGTRQRLGSVDTEAQRTSVTALSSKRAAIVKELSLAEVEIEKLLRQRDAILRKCSVEQIYIPVSKGSLSDPSFEVKKKSLNSATQRLHQVQTEMDSIAPNVRALDKLEGAEVRLRHAMESFERQRNDAKRARDVFLKVKQRRYELFAPCFKHVSESIDAIYKALTRDSESGGTEGTAYLSLEDSEEPYLEGIRFHAMPPGKRFLDMEALSGGERTIAALSLLFALHSFLPAPFFVLDEVDAALDNPNVARLAGFLRMMAQHNTQLLVISLKPSLYEQADALVGVYRTPGGSSQPLTLRLTDYDDSSIAAGPASKTSIAQDDPENVSNSVIQ